MSAADPWTESARNFVDAEVGRLVRQLAGNPHRHRQLLFKRGLAMLDPETLVARASAKLEQELARKTRGVFEFGLAFDLRALIALAQQEMEPA